MKNKKVKFLAQSAVIAALYVVFTLIASALGLSSHVIQVRFSEALTILPLFTSAAIPGLFVGCILANLLAGAVVFDVILGSIATLIGALGTWLIGKFLLHKGKFAAFLAPIPPILANMIIVPYVLKIAYGAPEAIPYMMMTVGIGEIISCGILGLLLYFVLNKHRKLIEL